MHPNERIASESHVHHLDAKHWFLGTSCEYATCPITQGALLRLLMNLDKLSLELDHSFAFGCLNSAMHIELRQFGSLAREVMKQAERAAPIA